MTRPGDIDHYIAAFPPATQEAMEEMRKLIKNAAPQAAEVIGYGMPAFKVNSVLVYFAGYKSHIGFYPTASGIQAFRDELSDYKWSKGAIQFPLGKPLPADLITQMVKFRAEDDLKRAGLKNKKQKTV